MERMSAATLPARLRLRMDRHRVAGEGGGGRHGVVLGVAILFAYLFLVALYESWNIPFPVLLSVSVGVLGAIVALVIAGLQLRRLCADRPRRAGRAGRQERHSDRRIRRRSAQARQVDPRGGGSWRPGCGFAR